MKEKILRHYRLEVIKHKRRLINGIAEHKLLLLFISLPLLVWGWKKGRGKGIGKIIKQLIKIGCLATVSYIKRQLTIAKILVHILSN
ncbi:hypothetical protein EP47_10585 [Legionella norrlandica]|uniref:Uncharacterized protein n=1 Tax=Legionella norrlandica TaxID=1498499 RepID=A0A0A2ST68_9GAMM|nr:hypothetical protein [Legionella norrlandica]KGP62664.1 hypothetical protein EP47_10585 [Legionella norrlandica]